MGGFDFEHWSFVNAFFRELNRPIVLLLVVKNDLQKIFTVHLKIAIWFVFLFFDFFSSPLSKSQFIAILRVIVVYGHQFHGFFDFLTQLIFLYIEDHGHFEIWYAFSTRKGRCWKQCRTKSRCNISLPNLVYL